MGEGNNNDYEWKKEAYKVYLEERNNLFKVEVQTAKQLDQALLTISGATLTLSLTFINYMLKKPPVCLGWLAAAWLCFGLTILVTLFSLFASRKSFVRQRAINKLHYQKQIEQDIDEEQYRKEIQIRDRWNKSTEFTNIFASLLFLAAWVNFGIFAFNNLK